MHVYTYTHVLVVQIEVEHWPYPPEQPTHPTPFKNRSSQGTQKTKKKIQNSV